MIGYTVRRFIQAIIVILGVVLIVFLLSQLIPGGVAAIALGPRRTAAAIAHFNQENGYNLPIYEQFWNYLWGLFHLNFGYSYFHNEGVQELIAQRLPKTLSLVGVSTLLALVIAVPLGILQVVRRYKPIDYVLTTLSFVFYAMPAFFLAFLLVLFFSFDLHIFPVSPPGNSGAWTIFTDPRAFVLPVVTLSALTIASFSRYMRSSMMDALTEDYIRTAQAKGASNNRVLYGHALRNALIPILTLIGLSLPAIASGALITESVFNYPGMGLLTVQSALNDDVSTILGTTLVITVFTVLGSFLADVLYAVADPRIRLGSTA
ncbi:MAG TPA: ABC transporter permease [Acidimicrobiales bacterium]|jgi:peptide/nickel transport system permease protein|nr:ABC transporter permease [Acidimicrobiales bacterium]